MDKLTIHNYEAYFLDYVEGNLNPQQQEALELFLDKHPDLRAELSNYEKLELSRPNTEEGFHNKILLSRDEQTGLKRLDYLLIAASEKVISDKEFQELSPYLSEATVLTKLSNYQKVKLKTDPSLKYPFKQSLKKKELFLWRNSYRYAAAAAVFIALLWIAKQPEARYDQRMPELPPINKTEKLELDLPTYTAKQQKTIRQEEAVHSTLHTTAADVEKLPMKDPINIARSEAFATQELHYPSIVEANNFTAQETEVEGEASIAYEKLEYSKLSNILFKALNRNLLNDQLSFSQEAGSKGKTGFSLVFGEIELSHSKAD